MMGIDELRAAVAARDELIWIAGHELRNAMAPLVLLASHFEAMPATNDTRMRVAMMRRNIDACIQTLERLGEVSSLREGKLALALADVDARDVVAKVCLAHATAAAEAGCELRFDTANVIGRWDRERLQQILSHLVGNAIRHAGGGPIEVSVRDDGSLVELVVHDAGAGIPVAERERLFDRFERFDRAVPRRRGLGVGLWIVKTLCHAMGGTVRLEDSARGARFVVALPR